MFQDTVSASHVQTTDDSAIVLTRIDVIVHVAKGSVVSEIHHNPVVYHCEDEGRSEVTHKARRFERAAACPIATGQALAEQASRRYPGVPVSLRFA